MEVINLISGGAAYVSVFTPIPILGHWLFPGLPPAKCHYSRTSSVSPYSDSPLGLASLVFKSAIFSTVCNTLLKALHVFPPLTTFSLLKLQTQEAM